MFIGETHGLHQFTTMAMRDGEENVVLQLTAKLNHLPAMTRRTEPATSLGNCRRGDTHGGNQAANSGKAWVEISTFKVLSDYLGNHRVEEAIFTREEIVLAILEVIKVIIE